MASRRTSRTAQALWSEIEDMKQELGSIVAAMEDAVAGGGAEAKQVVEEKARSVVELGTELVNSLASDAARAAGDFSDRAIAGAREVRDDGIARIEGSVRERPLIAISLAFAAGWLTARLCGRR